MLGDQVGAEWVILLEVADGVGSSTLDPESLRRMVASWPGAAPTILYSPNRYALQVTVRAADPPTALSNALSLWTDALRRAPLPAWDLVRAEIVTPEELEHELREAERVADDGVCAPASERLVADDLLRRALEDSVTSLPNRELFLDEVRRALARPLQGSKVWAVVAIAVDGENGRRLPDELLAHIAGRLAAEVRRGDIVARVGVWEFAALITAPLRDGNDRIGDRLLATVRAARNHGRPVAASAGVATASVGDDPDELLKTAEAAARGSTAKGVDCHRRQPASDWCLDRSARPPARPGKWSR